MVLLRSDALKTLVVNESELKNSYDDMCDPTIEDVECKDDKITDVILNIIKDNSIQSKLEPGIGISITNDTINARLGTGLTTDENNNIIVKNSDIKLPQSGNVTTVQSNGIVDVNIGTGLYNDSGNLAIDYGSLPLVTPVLTTVVEEWNHNNDVLLRTLTSNSVQIETGASININTKYKYVLGSSYSAPTIVSGDYGTGVVPNDTYSTPLIINNYYIDSGSISKNVTFSKPKSGLNVVNDKVVPPTGNDTTSTSMSISVVYPFYLGYSPTTPTAITGLSKKLYSKSGSLTYTGVTSSVSNYTYFIYPVDVTVTNIIMDGAAPVLGAFTRLSSIHLITNTGVDKVFNVLKSNALGAFNNNTLRFDFNN